MERIFQTSRCWTRRSPLLWTRSSKVPSSRRRSASRSRKPKKEDRFLQERQIAFMIYDYFRVTGAHDTVLDYANLCSVTIHDDNIQEFDTRWDEVLLSTSKTPSDDILESLYKLRIREFDQLKTVLELYDMEIHQKTSVPNYQKLQTMVKRSIHQKTSITKLWRQAWENWIRNSDKESEGINWRWRRKKVSVTSGKKKASVRKETDAVSATKPKIVRKNQNTLPPHLLSQPYHEVEVCRRREVSEAKVTRGPFFDNRADIIWIVPARERLVNIGIRPSANSLKMKRVVSQETRVCFRITRLMNNYIKSRKKSYFPKRRESDDKNALAISKSVSQLVCVSQDSDALVSQGRKSQGNPMQKVLEPTQRVRFTKSTLCHASIREKKGPSLGKINVKAPH